MTMEYEVKDRYAAAAHKREAELCCPVDYNTSLLKALPAEIIEKDYGCGDPTPWLRPGDAVLDLGSGGGKICYMAAQIVGPDGRVIGVDFNDTMLALARKYEGEMAERLGFANVEFRKGRIQDLQTDLAAVDKYLKRRPVGSADDLAAFESAVRDQRRMRPLVADDSIDVIVSNCVLNLVNTDEKARLFEEMHRVLKRGGRVVISDIVSDEDVPEELQRNPDLWSGCISGAYREDAFLEAFERAGFYGVEILKRQAEPWRVVDGIEFRSITVRAWKGKEGPCLERNQAVVYRGPWRKVVDDDGHTLHRGRRMAVCDKTFQIYSRDPYARDIELIDPREEISLNEARLFDCKRTALRHPRETKGFDYKESTAPPDDDCRGTNGNGSCC